MTLQITCPKCNFSKHIPRERIPAGARWATCPQCKHRFALASPEDLSTPEGALKGRPEKGPEKRRATPWENRAELGLWQGTYQTFKGVLFSPESFFSTMAYKRGMREPLAFGLLLGSIGSMFGIFWQFLVASGTLMDLGRGWMDPITMGLIFFGIIAVSPLFVLITMVLTSAILHLLLRMVRGGGHGFEATFRVVSYAQAAQLWGVIPFVGGLVGGLWLLIVQIVGLREIHETSYLRVFLALILPIAFLLLLAMAIVIPLLAFGFHQ